MKAVKLIDSIILMLFLVSPIWIIKGQELPTNIKALGKRKSYAKRYIDYTIGDKVEVIYSLSQLVKASSHIVIGRAESNLCSLSTDGKTINTLYKVKVQESFKGNLKSGKFIKVALPGGMYKFSNGTIVEIKTPWFKKMDHGQTYILFLNFHEQAEGYIPTGGPQGIFKLPTDNRYSLIEAHASNDKYSLKRYDRIHFSLFFKDFYQALKNR
jgi:hypothetical protein